MNSIEYAVAKVSQHVNLKSILIGGVAITGVLGIQAALNPTPIDPTYKALDDAEEAIRQQLKDPDSAKFAGLQLNSKGNVCGTVNAKNSFGGYTGARPFSYIPARNDLFIADSVEDTYVLTLAGC